MFAHVMPHQRLKHDTACPMHVGVDEPFTAHTLFDMQLTPRSVTIVHAEIPHKYAHAGAILPTETLELMQTPPHTYTHTLIASCAFS
jgi:hypothetical protein